MGSTERVDKFLGDAENMLGNPERFSGAKVQSEIARLQKWLQKHQDESLPDGHKEKLLSAVQRYYKFACSSTSDESRNAVHNLVDDLLKLPEGKLVTGKAKKQALKWLDTLQSPVEAAPTGKSADDGTESLQLIHICGAELVLMDGDTGETKQVAAKDDQLLAIKDRFDAGDDILVQISGCSKSPSIISFS